MKTRQTKRAAAVAVATRQASRRMNASVRWAEKELGTREQIRSVSILLSRMLKVRGVNSERFVRTIVRPDRQHAAAHLAERMFCELMTEASPAALIKCGEPRGVIGAIAVALGDWGPLDDGERNDLAVLADVVTAARERAMGGGGK